MGKHKGKPEPERSKGPNPVNPPGEIETSLMVVGVGASAGGLEAFSELLRHLPPNTGMAFVLVQHLDPHHESVLPELLSSKTEMPVIQVQKDTRLERDHIYIIRPNTVMLVRERSLTLEARPATAEKFRPVDAFFTSLAASFHSNAIGVVLSGTANDGTLGLKAIKAEGGITFAQNQSARFDGMPRSAIEAGVVDFILPPRRIAEELTAIAQRATYLRRTPLELVGDGEALNRLLLLVRKNTGVDFTQYKQPTILRRLVRRMMVRKSDTLEQYGVLLQKEPEEIQALFDDLLINVTDFFRDPEMFAAARRVVFPAIVRNRHEPQIIRAWVPGCSSGEEVYSLAIAMTEYLEAEDLNCTLQMFGTDISDAAIDKARAATYPDSMILNVSPERLRRFFVRADNGYRINRVIREICIFSRHNVATDPPLSRMDLISCRNLLIYFSPGLQRRVISTFGYSLQPSGCLILGPSETLGGLSEHFQVLDEVHKIYCRKPNTPQAVFHFAGLAEDSPPHMALMPKPLRLEPRVIEGASAKFASQPVHRDGPAGIVVNEDLRITEWHGNVMQYLDVPEMPQEGELVPLLRKDLREPVGRAINQARETNAATIVEGGLVNLKNGETVPINITTVPISLAGMEQYFLVLFGRAHRQSIAEKPPSETVPESRDDMPLSLEAENAKLRQELKSTGEYLQSVIEELRSTNEEAQSANEELQSTNEEMQTAKEELQSSNEELNTINAEMQSRNAELAQINDDLINLLGSMNMPIVMTGNDLCIRRFTPMAERVLHLISTDVGRPIADLKPRVNVPDLEKILQHVLDSLQPYEQEVQDQDGRLYLMRVRPYRTADNRIDGTVLQLLDVSELRRSLEEVRHARDYAEAVVDTVREPLVVLDQNLAIQDANRAFYDFLGETDGSAAGRSIFEVAQGRFDQIQVRALMEQLKTGSSRLNDVELEHHSEHNETRFLLLNARRIPSLDQKRLILMAFEDITERKRAAEARYRRLFDSARDGIVLVDASSGDILDLNPFAEQLLGYERQEVIGRKLWEIEAMQYLPKGQTFFEKVRDQGMLRVDDLILRKKGGAELHAELIASTYTEGERRAIQFNIRDVSERKKFEREMRETQKLESLGLLAGGIAHDFNNLLTGIIGNASMALAEVPAHDPLRIRLREVVNAGERAAFLTRQMLAYAGRGDSVKEAIDLGDLVSEISSLIRTLIPKTVELHLDLAPDLPPVYADPAQIQQVVMNLVINGAEAIGEEAGKVDVKTSDRELNQQEATDLFRPRPGKPGAYVQLEISDTGSGMDESTKARIFDPFFTTKFTGRGLGLAAVQGIVKGHEGVIRVYSTPSHGTSFLILLPATRRKVTAKAEEQPSAASIPPGSVALVIDDEETVRTVAEEVLSRAGMTVITASTGSAGIELFREHADDLSVVVLDLKMPVMGGDETLAQLKQINPKVPVVLSSGFDLKDAVLKLGEKPSGYLQKPYTAERLLHSVADVLNQHD
ncbi:MAG TPA: chemotaxis protein CheB [Bryobacteraceae bacterium]|nr:chemotaxis protein CheB [Bryobacteraceae bacterium]